MNGFKDLEKALKARTKKKPKRFFTKKRIKRLKKSRIVEDFGKLKISAEKIRKKSIYDL